MNCTICGLKLDARKRNKFIYASFSLRSKGFLANLTQKDYWVFCTTKCKHQADFDWASGKFESLHGHKKLAKRP